MFACVQVSRLRVLLVTGLIAVMSLSACQVASAQSSAANQWTWMGGSNTAVNTNSGIAAVYGTMGVPAPGNYPGSKVGPSSWTDNEGNFWLFGGTGAWSNELWEFNPATKEWTWVGGNGSTVGEYGYTVVYGTLGVPSAANEPGYRDFAASWTDSSGNLWLFGGFGQSATNSGYLNDLWEFNPTTNEWTWMAGSSTVPTSQGGQPGVYGTLGIPAAGNVPGGREEATSWKDIGGNLWLFGGYGVDSNGNEGVLNDLWKFNPATHEWVWMGGSSTANQYSSVYGVLGTPAAGNIPGGRAGAAGWVDSSGNFWLFSGFGLNDLWSFNPSTNEWAWMGGNSVDGVYGTLGLPAAGKHPRSPI